VHTRLGSFLPPAPTPPLPPTPPPPNTQQREYKNNRKEQGFLLVEIRIAIQGIDENWISFTSSHVGHEWSRTNTE
jgi:hypothetical protein